MKMEHRKCKDRESFCACTDGRGDRSGFPEALQRTGSRTDLHGDGQCKSHFLP